MTVRIYVGPMETVMVGNVQVRRLATFPTVVPDLGGGGSIDYGMIDVALVLADVTDPQHTAIVANAAITAFPANLNSTVGTGQMATVRQKLEDVRLPGMWVTSETTYREIARAVAGVMQFGQRHQALHGEDLIPDSASLSLRWDELPQARRTRILATFADLHFDSSWITNSMRVRRILLTLIELWGNTPVRLGAFTL